MDAIVTTGYGEQNHQLTGARRPAMTSTTGPIITQAQEQFEALLELVGGPGNRELSAAAAELTIFRGLLRLGATLLGPFFAQRGAERPVGPVVSPAGVSLPYHDRRGAGHRDRQGVVV